MVPAKRHDKLVAATADQKVLTTISTTPTKITER